MDSGSPSTPAPPHKAGTPFKCTHVQPCDKEFPRQNSLRNHLRNFSHIVSCTVVRHLREGPGWNRDSCAACSELFPRFAADRGLKTLEEFWESLYPGLVRSFLVVNPHFPSPYVAHVMQQLKLKPIETTSISDMAKPTGNKPKPYTNKICRGLPGFQDNYQSFHVKSWAAHTTSTEDAFSGPPSSSPYFTQQLPPLSAPPPPSSGKRKRGIVFESTLTPDSFTTAVQSEPPTEGARKRPGRKPGSGKHQRSEADAASPPQEDPSPSPAQLPPMPMAPPQSLSMSSFPLLSPLPPPPPFPPFPPFPPQTAPMSPAQLDMFRPMMVGQMPGGFVGQQVTSDHPAMPMFFPPFSSPRLSGAFVPFLPHKPQPSPPPSDDATE